MGKQVITTNKFPLNITDGEITGIGNLDITKTTSRSGLVAKRVNIPITNMTTAAFDIRVKFTTYAAWTNGDLLVGDYDKSNDNNDFRFFFASNGNVYFDFNYDRIYKSSSSYLGKVNNWQLTNYKITDLDTNAIILSGDSKYSDVANHLSRLSLWGYSDACIIHSIKVYKDKSVLVWDIIPYRDSQGYGLYDQVSHKMVYRVSNNNQVQTTQTVTQVQNLYWLDNMINKAYMGSNLIFEKTSVQYKLYIVNSQTPLKGTGGKIVAFLPYIKNVDHGNSCMRFEMDFIGFSFSGATIIRQTTSVTQGSKGSEMSYRFFATSSSSYYIDISYGRVNGNGPNCYNNPQHWSFCTAYTAMGSKLSLGSGWNNNNIVCLYNHNTNTNILGSSSSSMGYNKTYSYSWHTWGYTGEIYGFNFIKVYSAPSNNSGYWTLIRNWQAMENGDGTVYFHDTVKGTNVSLPGMYKYEYYAK